VSELHPLVEPYDGSDAELHVVEGTGHLGSPEKRRLLLAALDRFAG
jgi:hypothetical protein